VFNLQGSEIIVILLLALVVLGPEKLPDAIRKFSQTYSELKKMGTGFQSEIKSALDEPMREMRDTANLLRDSVDTDKMQADVEAEAELQRKAEAEADRMARIDEAEELGQEARARAKAEADDSDRAHTVAGPDDADTEGGEASHTGATDSAKTQGTDEPLAGEGAVNPADGKATGQTTDRTSDEAAGPSGGSTPDDDAPAKPINQIALANARSRIDSPVATPADVTLDAIPTFATAADAAAAMAEKTAGDVLEDEAPGDEADEAAAP